MSSPCPPPPPDRVAATRRHASCEVCRLVDGDEVLVHVAGGVLLSGPVRDLSTAGITLQIAGDRQFIPWTSVSFLEWQPIDRTDRQ